MTSGSMDAIEFDFWPFDQLLPLAQSLRSYGRPINEFPQKSDEAFWRSLTAKCGLKPEESGSLAMSLRCAHSQASTVHVDAMSRLSRLPRRSQLRIRAPPDSQVGAGATDEYVAWRPVLNRESPRPARARRQAGGPMPSP